VFSHILVNQLVQSVLPKRLFVPRDGRDVITRTIRFLHGLLERGKLFGGRLQFDLGAEFHGARIAQMFGGVNLQTKFVTERRGASSTR
jgi:hypothetical protein